MPWCSMVPSTRLIMAVYVDVIVDPDPAGAPFGKDVGSTGKGFRAGRSNSSCSCRRVTPSRRSGRSSFSRTSSSRIAFGEAVEPPVSQAPQQPALVGDLLGISRLTAAERLNKP